MISHLSGCAPSKMPKHPRAMEVAPKRALPPHRKADPRHIDIVYQLPVKPEMFTLELTFSELPIENE